MRGKSARTHARTREREGARKCVWVYFVCVRERAVEEEERESERESVCERERARVCIRMHVRERRECVRMYAHMCVRSRESLCVIALM